MLTALACLGLAAAAPADDLASLKRRLVELASRERLGVARAQTAAARLSTLNAAEANLKTRSGANQAALTRLLAALESFQRNPPPALLVSPRSARDAVNAAILMRATLPELRRRSDRLAQEGRQLNHLRREILIADGDLLGAEHDVADRRGELDALSEEKARIEDRLYPTSTADVAALGAGAGSLDELARGAPSLGGATPSAAPLALSNLIVPVSGAVVRHFGQAFPGHGRSEGWSWAAPAGALVVSPAAGRVLYAGPLKGWGFVVILYSPGGYHLVLAGLDRVSAHVGGEMVAGEPVGRIAKPASAPSGKPSSTPELYLEIRKAAQPLDPAPFFAGKTG